MSGMPEIGSKISLISKADIRYEGKLFTVNPNECTIALSSVRSYGTEDREVENPVPPQPQTYDFILFRGSDIKDIRVVNNQLPNDPAIVQMTVPPSMGSSSFQPDTYNPLLGQMGPSLGSQYPGMYNPMSGMAPGMGRTLIKPQQPQQASAQPQQSQQQQQQQQQSELVNLAHVPEPSPLKDHSNSSEFIGGSRSSTPGLLGSRKSPTIDQGVQVNQPKVSFGLAGASKDDKGHGGQQSMRPNHQRNDGGGNRNRGGGGGGGGGAVGDRPYNNDRAYNNERQYNNDGGFNRGGGDRDFRQQRRDMYSINHIRPNVQQLLSSQGQNQGQGQNMRVQQVNQGNGQMQRGGGGGGGGGSGWIQRGTGGNNMRSRGGRGRPQGLNFNRAPGQQLQQANNNQKSKTLKFEGDYDFDKANTEFEELRTQLAKVKIAEGGAEPVPVVPINKVVVMNGEDKKDDSGNETGIGEGEPEEEEQPIYYDKAKSFFDNISCEAVERSKGRSQRTDWRTERKLNSETFGVASARRSGFRGRGGYYTGGRGYGGRGGGGNYRGNYNNRGGGQGHPQGGNRRPNNMNPANGNSRPHIATAAAAK